MIYIEKGKCPENVQRCVEEFTAYDSWKIIPDDPKEQPEKKWPFVIRKEYFEKLPRKEIRMALYKEQHGLCAYCMSPLDEGIIYFKSDDDEINHKINTDLWECLFLNGEFDKDTMISRKDTSTGLVVRRKQAYDEGEEYIRMLKENNLLSPERIKKKIDQYLNKPIRKPFVGTTIFVLDFYLQLLAKKTEK